MGCRICGQLEDTSSIAYAGGYMLTACEECHNDFYAGLIGQPEYIEYMAHEDKAEYILTVVGGGGSMPAVGSEQVQQLSLYRVQSHRIMNKLCVKIFKMLNGKHL